MPSTIRAAQSAATGSLSALRRFVEAIDSAFEMKQAFTAASSPASAESIDRLRRAAGRN